MPSSGKKSNLLHTVLRWLKSRRFSPSEFVVLLLIGISAVLRLWSLDTTLQFLADQGRDALIVAKLFTELDPVFIGPVTSVGNMYLGPFYYYFMLPWLLLTYPSPIGPAYGVAILGILTTILIYYLGRKMFNHTVATVATVVFGFSVVVIEYSRFSWNPNPAPFFSLLIIFGLWQVWQHKRYHWQLAVFGGFAVLIQLHYLSLLSAAAIGIIGLLVLLEHINAIRTASQKQLKKSYLQLRQLLFWTATGVLIVLLSITPLILFDFKHDFLNARAFYSLVVAEDNFVSQEHSSLQEAWLTLRETHGRSMHLLLEILVGQQRARNTVLVVIVLSTVLAAIAATKKQRGTRKAQIIVATFLLVGILGTAFYKHTIFHHYLSFLFPVTAFVWGIVIEYWLQKLQLLGVIFTTYCLVVFAAYTLNHLPFDPIGLQVAVIREYSEIILDLVPSGDTYNVILLSENKDLYAQNYRYYLYALGKPPVEPEDHHQADHLVIINENQPDIRLPYSPIYEIVTFPVKEPREVYTITDGPTIMVLSREK